MGWFGSSKEPSPTKTERPEKPNPPPVELAKPIPRQKLPDDLQKLVDREDNFFERLYDGNTQDTTDTNVRYAAYAARARTILMSAHRYVAYTSDIGESFRPIAHPILVRGAYGISWAYLIGDVANEGYKAYQHNNKLRAPSTEVYKSATGMSVPAGSEANTVLSQTAAAHIPAIDDYRAVMAQRAVFQSIASMGLPAFTIHSIVRYSGRATKNLKNATIRTWAPIALGLAAVPALPFMFDEPVEEAVEWIFYNGFKAIGGEAAVGNHHPTHRKHETLEVVEKIKEKVKEL